MIKAMRNGKADPYGALGVARDATFEDIRKAFRRLAMEFHPDRTFGNKQAEAEFKEINDAHEILRDEKKRAAFDGVEALRSARHSRQNGFEDEFEDVFGDFFRSRSWHGFDQGARPRKKRKPRRSRAEEMAEEAQKRGKMFKKGASRPDKNGASRYTIKLTMAEAARGGPCIVYLNYWQSVTIDIPAGVRTGSEIEVVQRQFDRPWTILIKVNVDETQGAFRREADDIVVEVPISLQQAVLGGRISVPTTSGNIAVDLPAGLGGPGKFKVKGYGINGGNLIVHYYVQIPKGREPELAEFLKDWKPKAA